MNTCKRSLSPLDRKPACDRLLASDAKAHRRIATGDRQLAELNLLPLTLVAHAIYLNRHKIVLNEPKLADDEGRK
jgi:hypothetical protein